MNIEEIDILLRAKGYDELSELELELIQQNGLDEQSYSYFREMVLGVRGVKQVSVSTNQKSKLVKAFKDGNRKSTFRLQERKISFSWQLLTAVLAFVIGYYLMPDKIVEREKLVELPPKLVVDTLFVQLPPDTVIVEKYRIREVPVYLTKAEEEPKEEVSIIGSSLANQQKLKQLLIEGE